MPDYVTIWGILFVALVAAELITTALVSIWGAAASLVAMLAAFLGAPLWAQIVVFLAATALLLAATRPLALKLRSKAISTNAELDIGRTAIVTEDIDNTASTGRVKLNGVFWAAVSETGENIKKGSAVKVRRIDGSKLIVSKIEPTTD